MSVEDNRMFPVNVEGEEEQVRVFVKRSYPTGERLFEDADGNLYAATNASPAHVVTKIDSEDDLPFEQEEQGEPEENPNETVPPATGYDPAPLTDEELAEAEGKEDEDED
jgi:hypothetical protein